MGGYVNRTKIAQLYTHAETLGGQTVTVAGWVKSVRDMKNFGFVTLNDGSCFRDLQVVMNREALDNYDEIAHQNVSAALICTGTVKLTPDAPQPFELSATSIEVEGVSAPDYPLQKKRATVEFLRTQQHLRSRTNLFRAVFRVRSVEVTGSAYYTADEIRAACGVAQGDNLLTLSRARIAGNIMAELPYVSTVQVTRRLPDTLELTVTEYDVTYAAQGADGASYLITADGKITEKIDETAARGHIAVTGLQLADPVVGQQLTVAGDDDVAAQGQHDALCALLQALEEAGLTKKAASVAVPSSYELSFWYGDQYEVKLGNSENLPYKLAYLEKVLESLADYQTGTIDLSFSEGSEARFTPKQ